MRTKIFNAIKVSALALILSFGLSYALAWTAPTATPPGGNVATPINTSIIAQTKVGNLSIWDLVSNSLTTNALTIPGAVAGQVLTANAQGTAGWSNPAGGAGGGGNYVAHGSQSFSPTGGTLTVPTVAQYFTVPVGVTSVLVEVQSGSGAGCDYSVCADGTFAGRSRDGAGEASSFGSSCGAAIISATGGLRGGNPVNSNGPNGIGSGGIVNGQAGDSLPNYAIGGQGSVGIHGNGGNAGYSQGIFSVNSRQRMQVIVGYAGRIDNQSTTNVGQDGTVIIYW